MNKYFYDSYAIIEFIRGNNKFETYFKNHEGITNLYNFMEVYYAILKEGGNEKAKIFLESLKNLLYTPNLEHVEESMNFRYKNKKLKFSYADCLGYIVAKRLGIIFLTGDEAFKNFENVEFIKA